MHIVRYLLVPYSVEGVHVVVMASLVLNAPDEDELRAFLDDIPDGERPPNSSPSELTVAMQVLYRLGGCAFQLPVLSFGLESQELMFHLRCSMVVIS